MSTNRRQDNEIETPRNSDPLSVEEVASLVVNMNMGVAEAQSIISKFGYFHRVVCKDGVRLNTPPFVLANRINLTVQSGRVVGAAIN